MDAKLPTHTLLEAGELPLGALARFAQREGRRPKPIYQAHKWFARRLGCAFRSLLIGAVSDRTADFWRGYYEKGDLRGLTVLDPFVGGGTSVVESLRLGANVVGVDVDPIACAVTRLETDAGSVPELGDTLTELKETVGREMARYHRVTTPDGRKLVAVHHFWVQRVECIGCGLENDAHPNFVLADGPSGLWVVCSKCNDVARLPHGRATLKCASCGTETRIRRGPVRNGTLTCRGCRTEEALIDVGRRTSKPPSWHLFAIEAFEPTSSSRATPMNERVFVSARDEDRRLYAQARRTLLARVTADPTTLPSDGIPSRRTDDRLRDYGYRRWTDLFNDRQLLHMSLLAEAIADLKEPVRTPIAMAFSNHLTTNCMMTAYAAGWRRLTPLFSLRAFRHVPRPVELNPWTDGTGRGSFPNAVRQVIRAADYARAPTEPARGNTFKAIASRPPQRAPAIHCGSARDMSFIDAESVDVVLTDPPYFDNVSYSELADFFGPWLAMLSVIPKYATRRRTTSQTLTARRRNVPSAVAFGAQLGEAFAEVRRVLRRHGLLVFTYRHSTAEAWSAMQAALRKGRLRPVQVLPMPGEAGQGLHTHPGSALWDAVLVFRKQPVAVTELDARLIARADAHVARWRERLRRSELPFGAADRENLRRATIVAASLGLFGSARSETLIDLGEALRSR